MTYVVNDDETFNQALNCKCDAIMSDRAAWLVEQAGLELD